MTREEAGQRAKILQAYADGKEIEFHNDEYKKWEQIDDPKFGSPCGLYRVKKEPKYRPFKDANECFEEMLKHQPFGWVYTKPLNEFNNTFMQITLINDNGFRFVTDRMDQKYENAVEFDFLHFADGTPFGIKEE